MKGLNKTDFIQFLNCPESIWLLKNKSNIYYKGDFSLFLVKLINEGYEVEGYAKKIFPGGVEVPVDSRSGGFDSGAVGCDAQRNHGSHQAIRGSRRHKYRIWFGKG